MPELAYRDVCGLGMFTIGSLLEVLVANARAHMSAATELRERRAKAGLSMEHESYVASIASQVSHRLAGRVIGHSIRELIHARTEAEKAEAAQLADSGSVTFCQPACNTETCEACDRPLWQHIDIESGETLCPFGRRYWQIARATLAARYPGWPSAGAEFLAGIAAPK